MSSYATPILLNIKNPNLPSSIEEEDLTITEIIYKDISNQLVFTYTNNGSKFTIKPSDAFNILVPKFLIEDPEHSQLSLYNTPNWTLKKETVENNYKLVFQAKSTIEFNHGDAITIALEHIVGNQVTLNGVAYNFTLGTQSFAGAPIVLHVLKQPTGSGKSLQNALQFTHSYNGEMTGKYASLTDDIWISLADESGTLVLPLNNQLSFKMTCINPPLLQNSWVSHPKPTFYFTFSFASPDALTDVLKPEDQHYNALTTGWNIEPKTKKDLGNWTIDVNNEGNFPVWTITPNATNPYLFDHDHKSLTTLFQHILSILPNKRTFISLQWKNIPGYTGHAIRLFQIKNNTKNAATIYSFTSNGKQEVTADYKGSIRVNYEMFGAPNVLVTSGITHSEALLGLGSIVHPALVYNGQGTLNCPDFNPQKFPKAIYTMQPALGMGHPIGQVFDKKLTVNWTNNAPLPKITSFKPTGISIHGAGVYCLYKDIEEGFTLEWEVGEAFLWNIDHFEIITPSGGAISPIPSDKRSYVLEPGQIEGEYKLVGIRKFAASNLPQQVEKSIHIKSLSNILFGQRFTLSNGVLIPTETQAQPKFQKVIGGGGGGGGGGALVTFNNPDIPISGGFSLSYLVKDKEYNIKGNLEVIGYQMRQNIENRTVQLKVNGSPSGNRKMLYVTLIPDIAHEPYSGTFKMTEDNNLEINCGMYGSLTGSGSISLGNTANQRKLCLTMTSRDLTMTLSPQQLYYTIKKIIIENKPHYNVPFYIDVQNYPMPPITKPIIITFNL